MASLLLLFPPILLQYIILLILIQMPPYLSSYDYYTSCANLYGCGELTNIGFPFWGGVGRPNGCGHPLLQLICDTKGLTYITIKDVKYQDLEANPNNQILRITRVDYSEGLCPSKLLNTSLDPELFVYGSDIKNLTLFYGCLGSNAFPSTTGRLPCIPNGTFDEYVYTQFGVLSPPVFCKTSVVVPVPQLFFDLENFTKIQGAIRDGFEVRWIADIEECEECKKSGGVCGYNWNSYRTTCYCRDQSSDSGSKTCSFLPNAKEPLAPGTSSKSDWWFKTDIGASTVGAGVVVICIVIFCNRKRCLSLAQGRIFKKT